MVKPKNKLTNKALFLYLLIYKTTIEIVYVYLIAPLYGYGGLDVNINRLGIFISTISLVAITVLAPKNKRRPSTYLYVVLLIFVVIPALSFYWLNNQSVGYIGIVILALFFISMILKIKPLTLNIRSNTANTWLFFVFGVYLVISILLIVQRGGIDPRAFNFDSIYGLRAETELRGVWGYFLNWSTKAFAPFYFVYFYFNKKKIPLLVVVTLQLLMYLSFGNKAFLFSIGILILMTLIMRRGRFVKEFIISMSALNLLAYFTDKFLNVDILRRAIPYRLVYIPAQIQYQYYDFFKGRDKLLFAEGLIGRVLSIQSPFTESISRVIGMYYSRSGLGTNANTGIISDAYANGGVFGVIVISILFGVVLLFIDSTTKKLPLYVTIGSLSYITFVLNDTGLFTTLLTGGMGIMILLLMMFNSCLGEGDYLKRNTFNSENV